MARASHRLDSFALTPVGGSADLVQPSVVRPRAGQAKLVAFFRDRRAKAIYRACSNDDGKTWDVRSAERRGCRVAPMPRDRLYNTNPATPTRLFAAQTPSAGPLPNNNAGIEANLLASGKFVMVYNPVTSGRDPLAIALSDDEGMDCVRKRVLNDCAW